MRLGLASGLVCLTLASGCSEPPPVPAAGRVIVLGLDGMDPQTVDLMIGEGKLPHFARLRAEGASAPMQVDPPLLSPVIWTTIATGRRPEDHGIGHFTTTTAAGKEIPITSTRRRTPALWTIASAAGRRSDVVGWWATWPAESIAGTMVSDHTCYHFLKGEASGRDLGEPGLISPPSAVAAIASRIRRPEDVTAADLVPFAEVDRDELARPFDFADELAHLRWALGTAFSYRDVGLDLWASDKPDLLLVYIEATDSTSHLFGHLFRRHDLAGELADQQAKYGGAVEAMYELADTIVGRFLAVMDAQTTLVVLSDHGFELGELPTDPSKLRDMRRVSERYHRDHGILYLFGRGVRPGSALAAPRSLDVTPTVLALLGLPASQQMPGRVLTEGLSGITAPPRVASYEAGTPSPGRPAAPVSDAGVDEEVLAKLRSLGYIGSTSSASNDRNLAFLLLQDHRYAEAAAAFKLLLGSLTDKPGRAEAPLVNGYASALAGLGQSDLALRYFAAAITADPIFAPAYHNRAVLYERLGRRDEAITDYRTALRYDSDHEPSRQALARLGAEAGKVARTADEQAAARNLAAATAARKRGDYARAQELLVEAERLAPDAAVYQEMSNVAYLRGDHAGAIAALERALALDPSNALLRHNLERLRARQGRTPDP